MDLLEVAIYLPVIVGYSPPLTRVWTFSLEFCQEEVEFIWASKWASLDRKGTVETHTCEVECILHMGVVCIKQPKPCLVTYPVVLVL